MILTWSPLLNMINERLDLLAEQTEQKLVFLSPFEVEEKRILHPILDDGRAWNRIYWFIALLKSRLKRSISDAVAKQLFYLQSKSPFCILKCFYFLRPEKWESLEFPLKGFSNLFKRYTKVSWKNSSKKFLIQFKASNQGFWMVIWRA